MRLLKIFGFIAASIPALAFAGVQVLGVELGVSTLEQVNFQLAKKAGKLSAGTSKLTGGRQLKTNGAGYGIYGLTGVSYIFDMDRKLAAVVMDMTKSNFNRTYDLLAGKYKLTPKQRPGIGTLYAKFEATGGTIELDGMRQGVDMQARYVRNDVFQRPNPQIGLLSQGKT